MIEKKTLKKFKKKDRRSKRKSFLSLRLNPLEKDAIFEKLTHGWADHRNPWLGVFDTSNHFFKTTEIPRKQPSISQLKRNRSLNHPCKPLYTRFNSLQRLRGCGHFDLKLAALLEQFRQLERIRKMGKSEKQSPFLDIQKVFGKLLLGQTEAFLKGCRDLMSQIEWVLPANEGRCAQTSEACRFATKLMFARLISEKTFDEIGRLEIPVLFDNLRNIEFLKILKKFKRIWVKDEFKITRDLSIFNFIVGKEALPPGSQAGRRSWPSQSPDFKVVELILDVLGCVIRHQSIELLSQWIGHADGERVGLCRAFQSVFCFALRVLIGRETKSRVSKEPKRRERVYQDLRALMNRIRPDSSFAYFLSNFGANLSSVLKVLDSVLLRRKRVRVPDSVLSRSKEFPISHFIAKFLRFSNPNFSPRETDLESGPLRQVESVMNRSRLKYNSRFQKVFVKYFSFLRVHLRQFSKSENELEVETVGGKVAVMRRPEGGSVGARMAHGPNPLHSLRNRGYVLDFQKTEPFERDQQAL